MSINERQPIARVDPETREVAEKMIVLSNKAGVPVKWSIIKDMFKVAKSIIKGRIDNTYNCPFE